MTTMELNERSTLLNFEPLSKREQEYLKVRVDQAWSLRGRCHNGEVPAREGEFRFTTARELYWFIQELLTGNNEQRESSLAQLQALYNSSDAHQFVLRFVSNRTGNRTSVVIRTEPLTNARR